MLQVFDSWGGELSPDMFVDFSLPYLVQIASRVKQVVASMNLEAVPMVVFAKVPKIISLYQGAHDSIDLLTGIGYDVVGLDWTVDPVKVRSIARNRVTLQGNADPALLYAPRDVIRKQVSIMLEKFGPGRHIANLGHGMHPDHDPMHLQYYLEAVRDFSSKRQL